MSSPIVESPPPLSLSPGEDPLTTEDDLVREVTEYMNQNGLKSLEDTGFTALDPSGAVPVSGLGDDVDVVGVARLMRGLKGASSGSAR